MHVDPESITMQLSCQYLFTLLESASIKAAALRMLMKFTLGGSPIKKFSTFKNKLFFYYSIVNYLNLVKYCLITV